MGYEWKGVIRGREAGLQEESGEEAWVALLRCSKTPRFPPSASSPVRACRDSCSLKICVGPLSPTKFFSGEVCIFLWSRRMQTQMVSKAEVWIQSAMGWNPTTNKLQCSLEQIPEPL